MRSLVSLPALAVALAAAPRITAAQPVAYAVAYDVGRVVLPGWRLALVGVAVGAAGLALLRVPSPSGRAAAAARAAGTSLALFGFFGALVVGGGVFAQHARLRAALRAGTFSVVEGTVFDRPPAAAGERAAAWVVESGEQAHWYRYDRSLLSIGYRRAGPGEGGLRDGARVRLVDVGGRIARVEVVRP
jgi:hypothetical protein